MNAKPWHECTEDEILDQVSHWHKSDVQPLPLHEFLGMKWEEYAAYVERDLEAAKAVRKA